MNILYKIKIDFVRYMLNLKLTKEQSDSDTHIRAKITRKKAIVDKHKGEKKPSRV